MKYLWAICALLLPPVIGDDFWCDFGRPENSLITNAVVICHVHLNDDINASVVCPHEVNDTDYVWHPKPSDDDPTQLNTYVSESDNFRSFPISEVIKSEATKSLIFAVSALSGKTLDIIPIDELVAITEHRLIFICGPRNLVLSDTLQRLLGRLKYTRGIQKVPWTAETPLNQEVKKIGQGLGVFFLYRGREYQPFQGCGTRDSPLFAAGNEVIVDPVTGTRSCVVDPMSESRIGFVCDDVVVPSKCMKLLIDKNGTMGEAPLPHLYSRFKRKSPWVIAKYFSGLALPPIDGECRCMHYVGQKVKAKLIIRTKKEYVCDIASMIMRDQFRHIRGHWCSVVLHPGSTLTIRFPPRFVNSVSADKDSDGSDDEYAPRVPFSTLPYVRDYESEFQPEDLITLRQQTNYYDLETYEEVSYHRALAGDALELDVSQMERGEVTLKYNAGKPLTIRNGHNSFFYHWTMISRNAMNPTKIRAIINVSFAFTHKYDIAGCDRSTPGLFNPEKSAPHCSFRTVGNGIGKTYECSYSEYFNGSSVGINCGSDDILMPSNCDSTMYDLDSNSIVPLPQYFRKTAVSPIRGFQAFLISFTGTRPVSYGCVCVDKHGKETARIVLQFNDKKERTYKVSRNNEPLTLHPYFTLPWSEVGLVSEGFTPPEHLVLHNVSQKSIILDIGTSLYMGCDPDVQVFANYRRIQTAWFPTEHHLFYYSANEMPYGYELVRKKYNESFATTPGALKVVYDDMYDRNGNEKLTVKTSKEGIIISKDITNTQYVPVIFVCGKRPEASDLSDIIGKPSTSKAPSEPIHHASWTSMGYTWNVIKIKVKTTDPYMQGCGVTYESTELFKPETRKLYDANGREVGCKIDLQASGEAAFYCPAPYVLYPPGCFNQVLVDGKVKYLSDISQSLVASRTNHFVTLEFDGSRIGRGETLRMTPPLECQCVTIKGVVLSTIQIKHYYSK
ncbi:hypothetical protein BBBOND_0109960 [Babesia bigemina]|uniref:6-Cys domain-containing protein n=1 Tax=Babesia bigemina TaxID=5866 RepID=A0A061D250_BABBI|nr:hypothetical protein BBBOND_0109960 [Babesia bigemina]CDR94698.1 hypothetical protein BBBOND_0109960 [Babesia bigemina]|eukprot:XP_012766884.1 hypothetical protein BBBOND_0109960 [Babesia bigemina]